MPKKKQSPLAYARQLYMADQCKGAVSTYRDYDIIDCRLRAFIDGVNWQKRQARAKKNRGA